MTFWKRTPEENRRMARGRAVASLVGGVVLAAKGLYDLRHDGARGIGLIGVGLVFVAIGLLLRKVGAEPR